MQKSKMSKMRNIITLFTGALLFCVMGIAGVVFSENITTGRPAIRLSPTKSGPSHEATATSIEHSNGAKLENNNFSDANNNTTMQIAIPSCFIDIGEYAILVEKSTQKLYLYDKDYKLLKTFIVTTGQRQGDKALSGDLKTPEGVYFFTVVKDDRELLPQYGVMALPINYPNFIDNTILRKGGNGIWLHATDQPTRPLKPFDTRGCVVATNEDILELAEYINLQTTPMVIVEKIEYDTLEKIANTRQEIYRFIQKWQANWENKNIDGYMDSYSKNFKSNGMGWQKWRKYKESLNHQYKNISIALSDVKILRHSNNIVISFTQKYTNNKLTSLGVKRLYLALEDDTWKIVGEEWSPIPTLKPANVAKRYASLKTARLETMPTQTETNGKSSLQQTSFEAPSAENSSMIQSIASEKTTTLPDHGIQKEQLASSKEQAIDIEGFTIDREKAANKIRFKLVNKTMEQYKISGRLAIIAANRNDKGVRYTSYPPMTLEQGIPKDFRKGEWFSIRRFKIVNGEIEEKLATHVVVVVYSNTGELLLQKEFPIQNDEILISKRYKNEN